MIANDCVIASSNAINCLVALDRAFAIATAPATAVTPIAFPNLPNPLEDLSPDLPIPSNCRLARSAPLVIMFKTIFDTAIYRLFLFFFISASASAWALSRAFFSHK